MAAHDLAATSVLTGLTETVTIAGASHSALFEQQVRDVYETGERINYPTLLLDSTVSIELDAIVVARSTNYTVLRIDEEPGGTLQRLLLGETIV